MNRLVLCLCFVLLAGQWAGAARGQSVWTDEHRFSALRMAIDGSARHGLAPADYHAAELARLSGHPGQERDMLANDALVLLVNHLRRGKVDGSRYQPGWSGAVDPALAESLAAAPDLAAAIDAAAPENPLYRSMMVELELYRSIAAQGGWTSIGPGPPLAIGSQDARVAQVAARLRMTGDLRTPSEDPNLFDEALKTAVMGFQRRMGLEPNGSVTPAVVTEMNRPVEERIKQLRVNMDRARALMADLPSRYLIVNIAGFEAYLVDGDMIVWRSRVQVGKPFRQTPQLRSAIDQIVLNPTWTVPPTILAKDIAPAAVKDPGYVARRELVVTDRQGRVIDPRRINWKGPLPYRLQQKPGPDNAMGRVKFLFANPYSVYLHDTPSKSLFDSPARTFSSGCVRLERPLELADLLLAHGRPDWTPEKTQAALAVMTTKTVKLQYPATILLAYWTAWVDPAGTINFRRDIYGLDDRWAAALDQPRP